MNYLLLAKKNIVDPLNNYVVEPVITKPINNYIVTPIHNLIKKEEEEYDEIITEHEYEPYPPYPPSTLSAPLLDNDITYLDNVKQKLYYSGISLKSSVYFFINAWFPNYFKDEGYTVLENLKKND